MAGNYEYNHIGRDAQSTTTAHESKLFEMVDRMSFALERRRAEVREMQQSWTTSDVVNDLLAYLFRWRTFRRDDLASATYGVYLGLDRRAAVAKAVIDRESNSVNSGQHPLCAIALSIDVVMDAIETTGSLDSRECTTAAQLLHCEADFLAD
jgi:hypothetical protein